MSSINSTNRSSLSAAIDALSFGDGGDIAAVLDAVKAGVVNELTGKLKNSANSASLMRQQLSALLKLRDELPRLSVLGDAKTVTLGTDMGASNAVVSELGAAGLSLNTSQSYYIQVDGGAKHIATPTELAAAQAATLTTSTSSPATETRSVTDSSNKTTVYKLYKDEGVLTASKADVDSLTASINAALPALQLAVHAEDVRLQASIRSVQTTLEPDDKPQLEQVDIRKIVNRTLDAHHASDRKDIVDEGRRHLLRDRDDAGRKHGG